MSGGVNRFPLYLKNQLGFPISLFEKTMTLSGDVTALSLAISPTTTTSLSKKTADVVPGNWKVVGIQIYMVEESEDTLAALGLYSKDFKKENYECADEEARP